jgi:hypothetical protein
MVMVCRDDIEVRSRESQHIQISLRALKCHLNTQHVQGYATDWYLHKNQLAGNNPSLHSKKQSRSLSINPCQSNLTSSAENCREELGSPLLFVTNRRSNRWTGCGSTRAWRHRLGSHGHCVLDHTIHPRVAPLSAHDEVRAKR